VPKFSRGERNFSVQRPEAEITPEQPLLSGRDRCDENRWQDPRKNGLFFVDGGFRGSGRLDGGDYLDQTACSPRRHRTGLQYSSQERNFLLQRQGAELASFALIARAETALVEIRDGKTGFRAANTMSGDVPVYKRIQKRFPDAKAEDHILLPEFNDSFMSSWSGQDLTKTRKSDRHIRSTPFGTPRLIWR
jgi:hypothetical protein